jgi:hypothetical protein
MTFIRINVAATRWLPAKHELRAIRDYARFASGKGLIRIEPGIRCNDVDENVNIKLLTDDEDWGDTDLSGFMSWYDFKRHGVELTEAGEAEVDMYVSSVGPYAQLETNIQVHYAGGRIVRMSATEARDCYACALPLPTSTRSTTE